jgi:ubiquinone/menaquinone biosynthesis C-methylase UbiE
VKLNRLERWVVNSYLRRAWIAVNIRFFRRHGGIPQGASMIEIGCGEGRALPLLRRRFLPRGLAAFDIDIRMLRRLLRRDPAPVAVADAALLPLGPESCHAVFGFGVLHHVPDWQRALAEITAVLKPGGVFCFEEFYPALYQNALTRRLLDHPVHNRFHSRSFKREFDEIGLPIRRQIEIRPFYIIGIAVKG